VGDTMNQEKITKFITELRKEKNLTQQEFADILGVTNSAVSKWESGKCLPDSTLYEPIAKTFNVSIRELLAGKRKNKNKYSKILIVIIILLFIINATTIVKYYQITISKTTINKLRVSNDNMKLTGILLHSKNKSYILISNIYLPLLSSEPNNKTINNLQIFLKSNNNTIMKVEKDSNEDNNTFSFNDNFFEVEHLNPDSLIIEYSYFDGLKEVRNQSKIHVTTLYNN
jgi:transcriptional regulator with XRE-family HTH domain